VKKSRCLVPSFETVCTFAPLCLPLLSLSLSLCLAATSVQVHLLAADNCICAPDSTHNNVALLWQDKQKATETETERHTHTHNKRQHIHISKLSVSESGAFALWLVICAPDLGIKLD